MRLRRISLLVLMVALPLAGLSWFAVRLAQQERAALERERRQIEEGRLLEVEASIRRLMAARRVDLERELANVERNPDALRELGLREPQVSLVFWQDRGGRLRFPGLSKDFTKEERAFVNRTASLWEQADVFAPSPEDSSPKSSGSEDSGSGNSPDRARERGPANRGAGAVGEVVTDLSPRKRPPPRAARDGDSGWYSWFWEQGLRLIYWKRLSDGDVVGAELNRARFLADVIAALPESEPRGRAPGRVRLLDARGRVLHQWGDWAPEPGQRPHVERLFGAPLGGWKLADYIAPQAARAAATPGWLLGATALGLVFVLIAILLYLEMTRAAREAEQRVNFVNQVSHELKTPLTNIRMYAELLAQKLPEQDSDATRRARVIVEESERLSRLIQNVLTFAAGKRGTLHLQPRGAVLDDLVTMVLESFRPSLERAGIRVEAKLNAPEPGRFDPDAIGQILANLISNVEKYAAAGGLLEIETQQAEGRWSVRVADRGPGIPAREASRVFSAFYRVRDDVGEGASGTGLGLTLARELARLHGGELAFESVPEGACFRLTFEAL